MKKTIKKVLPIAGFFVIGGLSGVLFYELSRSKTAPVHEQEPELKPAEAVAVEVAEETVRLDGNVPGDDESDDEYDFARDCPPACTDGFLTGARSIEDFPTDPPAVIPEIIRPVPGTDPARPATRI